ncbi:MAG: glycosyl hydrolase [Firmicutes bacterium]|nr:glycosyl hydrolase [Bacillota bacterium]
MGNTRMYDAINDYGDRIGTVGMFSFNINLDGTINETGVPVSSLSAYRAKWPHIKWLCTCMNNGDAAIFTALRNNTNGARDTFLSELIRIMQKYPWCAGIDIDLERGGGYENKDAANQLFSLIYSTVKGYSAAKQVNICLPGMTGVEGSVGGENWCVYADLDAYCDTAAIMSYGMAWAGSAPGPVSPRDWLEGIYNYAVKAMDPKKIFMGLPGYGWEWQIYALPSDLGKEYRGVSVTYYAAKLWAEGGYNFTGNEPPEPFIPWLAYWDDYNKVPYMFPHIYDYAEGGDASSKEPPIISDTYNRRRYLTCYGKEQKAEFGTVFIDRDGTPDDYTDGIIVGSGMVTLSAKDGAATYNFNIEQAGIYDIAVKLCFPFWDRNEITIELDGISRTFTENRLWWPYFRKNFWAPHSTGVELSEGAHTLTIKGGAYGTQFYGFRVCSAFSEKPFSGSASFALSPRSFKDVDGNVAVPDKGFKLTTEVLRRKPDSALIWYEDFRDPVTLQNTYWKVISGSWAVWRSDQHSQDRVYSQLEGSGQLAWNYEGFSDVHIRARIAFPQNGGGKAGVFLGDIYCAINIDNQRIELYQGASLLGSWQGSYSKTPDKDIHDEPNMYLFEMRKRGNKVRVYSGNSNTLRFTAQVSPSSGYSGLKSDGQIKCELLRLGDAWTYEPYEAFDVKMPDGSTESYGRIDRANVLWDSEFQVFTLQNDVEESATRSEDISMDYDFVHSPMLSIPCNADYTAVFIPRDINVWCSRLFLGDADGFGIVYYQDVDSLVYWANEAAYRWGLRGFALWSLGQEDLRLWAALPKQT